MAKIQTQPQKNFSFGPALAALVIAVAVVALIMVIIGVVVSALWNFVLPQVFGLPHISWLEADVLVILVSYVGRLLRR